MTLLNNPSAKRTLQGAGVIAVGALCLLISSLQQHGASGGEKAMSVKHDLDGLIVSQHECALAIGSQDALFRWSVSPEVDTVARAFEVLSRISCDENTTVELLDARGDVLVWVGRSWQHARGNVPQEASVRIFRSGSFTILESIYRTGDGGGYVRLTYPLSSDNRITADVVSTLWLGSDMIPTQPRLYIVPEEESVPGEFDTIPIQGLEGGTIGKIAYRKEDLPANGLPAGYSLWMLLLCGGVLWIVLYPGTSASFLRLIGSLLVLWLLRLGVLLAGITHDPFLGYLGDPTVYASSFGNGLVGSPFDLVMSTAAFFLSVTWIRCWVEKQNLIGGLGKHTVLAGLFLPTGAGILIMLTRGYAASIQSIVVDSTVSIYDNATLLPSSEVLPLLVASLLLTISLVHVWKVIVTGLAASSAALGFESWMYTWGLVILSVLIATGVYAAVDGTDVLPPWTPFAGLGAIIPLVVVGERYAPADARNRLAWALAIALFSLPTLDWHVHLAQKDQIRRNLEERTSPGDAWLTFLMQTDLESIAVDDETIRLLSGAQTGESEGTAFSLWTSSVMSRQSANSGIVIFDGEGREVDRFVIGFSTFEQDAILRTVFEGAEERIYVVEGGESRRLSIYGAWSTVRDKDNTVYGTIATVLSPSDEQPLYWAVGTPSSGRRSQYPQARIEDSMIVSSGISSLHPGDRLDPQIMMFLERSDRSWVWVRDRSVSGEVLFIANDEARRHVTAMFVPDIDIRWHMFHIAKIILVYGVLLLCASLYRYVRDRRKGKRSVLTFRSKMFAVFTVVSTAPLVLLAIYNDQISEERTEQEVRRSLEQTGEALVDRLEELFQTEFDLDRGISNDFCASLAADQGVEFSVYRDYMLSASSRPEVFESGILGRRLDADVFTRLILKREKLVIQRQSIGPVSYAVGYFVWNLQGKRAGIISVPTLFRQGEIEADLAERNAYVLVAYGFALILVLLLGWYFSDRVTRPLRMLTSAAGALGRGESVPALGSNRTDEIGTLVRTFDEMVRELDENRKLLAKAEREQAWREMAKQVAHEIKNPLTPMKLSVQQLLQSFKDKARNREETLWDVSTTLLEQIDALSRIASEFSHFARLPQGKFEKVDVYRAIREAAGLFSSVPGISFELNIPDGHAYVIADADELRRVFVNLIRNGIQAMEGSGKISVLASIRGRALDVMVEDTGPGVPDELTEKVFEPNFSTKTEGMGLGLAISRKILEDLGGSIQVTQSGAGACFTMKFPLQ